MTKAQRFSSVVLVAMLAMACGPTTESPTGRSTAAVQTGEELALLAFVNDQANVTFAVLDDDCALRSDAARKIIKHRDGNDQVPGTADDNLFDSVAELDGVTLVGPVALERLAACADSLGYAPTHEEIGLVNFLNDQARTNFEVLDVDCGLRSNAAQNLIAHRDGADGQPGTADDNFFHSADEVDSVSQVGPAALDSLLACAEARGYAVDVWTPETPAFTIQVTHPGITAWVENGVIHMDRGTAPDGEEVVVSFDGLQLGFTCYWYGFNVSGVGRSVPEGYGGEDLGSVNGVQRVRITRDPLGTITANEALQIAHRDLIEYLQNERMLMQDWQISMPSFVTWDACVQEGILDDIAMFGSNEGDFASTTTSTPTEYEFSGRGPFRLGTIVKVSKADGVGTYFRVEID